jgi:peroxiredoxin
MRWLRNLLSGQTGGQNMAALTAGAKAPDFDLKTSNGRRFSLQEALRRGPVVLAFFKVSCPVCQYAFPFLQRLHTAYGESGVTLAGVSQNDPADTSAFMKEFGVTFPVVLDTSDSYPVSNAYGLTNVPTLFWIDPDGDIEISSVGWVKTDFEEMNRRMAESGKVAPFSVFKPGEEVRDFRAG